MAKAPDSPLFNKVDPKSPPSDAAPAGTLPGSPAPNEQLPTSAASNAPPAQPPAAYLPVGATSPTPAPSGEPGIMPEGGQGTDYKEGELEELRKKDPGPAAVMEAGQKRQEQEQKDSEQS